MSRAGLNYADTHSRENTYLAPAQLPQVPGGEVAGVREDTGERVVALCGTGGYAEYAKANERLVFPIPEAVDDGTALALIVQGLTAWHLLRTSTRVQPGETVVVQAAAGGVGTLALQLAKPFGAARVIAVASTEEKRALALELGADAAIDADPEGMSERIVEANAGRPVDVVLEMAGGAVFDAVARRARPVRPARGLRRRVGRDQQARHRPPDGELARRHRLLARPLRHAAGDARRPARRSVRARCARRAARDRRRDLPARGRGPRARRHAGAPDDRKAAARSVGLSASADRPRQEG